MADNAAKAMADAVVDTWSSGNTPISNLLTDYSEAAMGRDSIGIGFDGTVTVNQSETGSVQARTMTEVLLTKDQTGFINQAITLRQAAQLQNGAYAREVARSHNGALQNDIDRNLIMFLINNAAQADFFNAATGAFGSGAVALPTDDVIASAESAMLSQPGSIAPNLEWIAAPVAVGAAKLTSAWTPGAPFSKGDIGYGTVDNLNGYPLFSNAQVPGQLAALRKTVVSTAWAIAANVQTITIGAGHGLKAGDLITFDTVTAGGDIAAASVVATSTATTVTLARTACNANATEAGLITVQQGYLLLVDKAKTGVAFDYLFPRSELVKLTGDAGHSHQLAMLYGRQMLSGAVKVVRTPVSLG